MKFGTPKITKGLRAASRPTQGGSQSVLPTSTFSSSKATSNDLKGSGFEDDAFWALKIESELADLTRASFGWSDDEATNKKIWMFSAREALQLSGSAVDWASASFVEQELCKKAPAFERATFVLRMQASAGPFDAYTSLPLLVGELTHFVH